MLKYFLIILFVSTNALAFLDSIADTGKETARGVAISTAVAGLLEESIVGVQQAKSVIELKNKLEQINKQLSQIKDIDENTRKIIRGVDYSETDDLATNINRTTDHIRLVKTTLTSMCMLSPDTCTAISGITTNNQLNQIIQNQNQEAIEKQKEKTDLQRRRINMYASIKQRLETNSKLRANGQVNNYAAKLAIDLYESSFKLMLILLPIIFLGTLIFNNFFGTIEDQFEGLKNLAVYMLIAYGFKLILPFLIDLPYLVNETYKSNLSLNYDQALQKYVVSEQNSSWSFDIISVFEGIVQVLEAIVQIIVDMLFVFLSLIAPIIIMLSVMLNLGVGVKLLFGLMFILSTWNISIVACDLMVKNIITSDWNLNAFIVSLMGVTLKILAGAANILLALKSQAGGAVFGKSLGVIGNAMKSAGSKGGSAIQSYATNTGAGLEDKMIADALRSPPTVSGTVGGLALADRKLAQQQAAYENMRQAYAKAGIPDPETQRKEKEAAREQDKKQREQENAARKEEQKYARAAKILSEAKKQPSRLEGFKGGSPSELIQFSNDRTKASVDKQLEAISSKSSSGGGSSESSGFGGISTEKLAEDFEQSKSDIKDLDSALDYMDANHSEYTPEQVLSTQSLRDNIDKSRSSMLSELEKREISGDQDASEFLETGHINKKKRT